MRLRLSAKWSSKFRIIVLSFFLIGVIAGLFLSCFISEFREKVWPIIIFPLIIGLIMSFLVIGIYMIFLNKNKMD